MAQASAVPASAPVGAVITPPELARWLVRESGAVRAWREGAVIGEPSFGRGAMLIALVDEALAEGIAVTPGMLARVWGVERQAAFLADFLEEYRSRFGMPPPDVRRADFLRDDLSLRADLLIGNPPWVNFCDLPAEEKAELKPFFPRYALADSPRAMLLGGARVDLAALFVQKAISEHLGEHGRAAFLLPLSLFQNEGAHGPFRRLATPCGIPFALERLVDFGESGVFPGVASRCGAAFFHRGRSTCFPVPYRLLGPAGATDLLAAPLDGAGSPLAVRLQGQPVPSLPQIDTLSHQIPRQGANTCGANRVLLFDRYPQGLPGQFLFPVLTRRSFSDPASAPERWILLAHDPATGQPLSEEQARSYPELWSYLDTHREVLGARRGLMIGSWLRRGRWWACLGVGTYSFAPWRVAWEAYGTGRFEPRVFGAWQGRLWQGNQALHATIPCGTRQEAEQLASRLAAPGVEAYLRSTRSMGTRNWAQPGRIKRLLRPAIPPAPTWR